ncbi:MAG TPA: hypothetical protein VFU21_18105 [Kofleriaceae bacterium]|nr:hypothetical protein [Kofleriaceae bacterium]
MPERRRMSEILASHATLKLATSGGGLSPWIATAYFAADGLFCLEILIEKQGNTLANIRADARVAVMIEDGVPSHPFAQGWGRAVVAETAERAPFASRIAGKTPSSEPLVSLPHLLPVRLLIERWRITDLEAGWLPAREIAASDAGGAAAAG